MTTTTRYEIQTRTVSTPWQREASSEDYETRSAAEADAAKLEPTNDDGAALQYRVVEVARDACPVCGQPLPSASRDRRVSRSGVTVCGDPECEENANDLPLRSEEE